MSDDATGDSPQKRGASQRKFETIFEHCNPAAEELVEYSREELQSMPASDLQPEQYVQAAPKLKTALGHVLRNAVEHNDTSPLQHQTLSAKQATGVPTDSDPVW